MEMEPVWTGYGRGLLMKTTAKLLFSVIAVVLCVTHTPRPVWASDANMPLIKAVISDDQSIVITRMLYEALKRSNYEMVSAVTGMRTAVVDVNYGDAAILSLQTDG